MNRIYKVIWSKVKNCYVVTHEFAKAHGKTATKAITAAILVSAMSGIGQPVFAAPWGEELGQDTVANNTYSISTGSGSIAIGKGAVATGNNYTAEQLQAALKDAKAKQDELEKATNEYNQAQNEYAKAKADFDANNEVYAAVEAAKARMDAIQNEINNTYKPAADAANADYTAKKDAYETAYNDFKNRLEYIKVIDFNLADVNTDAGLTQLATDLKTNTEQGTPFNQPIQFYKDYIQNYIKAKGDLRDNKVRFHNISIYNKENLDMNMIFGNHKGSGLIGFLKLSRDEQRKFNLDKISLVELYSLIYSFHDKYSDKIVLDDEEYHSNLSELNSGKMNMMDRANDYVNLLKDKMGLSQSDADAFVSKLGSRVTELVDCKTSLMNVYHEQYLYEKYRDEGNNTEALRHLSLKERYLNDYNNKNNFILEHYESYYSTSDKPPEDHYTYEIWNLFDKWYRENIKDCEDGVNVTLRMVEDGLGNDIKDKKAAYEAATTAKEQADKNLADQQAALENAKPTPEQEAEAAKSEEKAKQLENTKNKLAADKEALEKAKDDISKLVKISDIGENGIAFGTNALTSGKNAVGIGTSAVVTGEEAIGIGKDSVIAGKKATSVGTNNKVSGANSTAVGRDITITGEDSIAIGTGHTVTGSHSGAFGDPTILNADDSYTVGNNGAIGTGSENSFLFGNDSTIGNNATRNFVLGNNSKIENNVSGSFVLGNRSYTNSSNAVVLGNNAIASAEGSVALGLEAVASEAHTVSVGHKQMDTGPEHRAYDEDLLRRIVNVGAGTSATDAATVAQTATLSSKDNTVTITETINENGSKNYDLHSEGTTYSAGNGISITSEGVISTVDTVLQQTAQSAVKVVDGENTTVTSEKDPAGNISYKVKVNATGQVAANNTGLVDGGTVFNAIQNVSNTLDTLGGNVVLYDGTDKTRVTFGGTSATSRVQLTNVKDAVLSETSTDAVTGQQLYKTNQDIIGFATDIATNKNNIEGMNQSVTAAQASAAATSRLVTTLNTAKADKSLSNLSDAGKLVLQSYATNAVQEYMKANPVKPARALRTSPPLSGTMMARAMPAMMPAMEPMGDPSPAPVEMEDILASLDEKANTSDMEAALSQKADKTELQALSNSLADKADKADLSLKADLTYVDEALSAKADKEAVETALAGKADKAETEAALALKADTAYVNEQLDTKADKSSVYDKQAVDDFLKGKADTDLSNLSDKGTAYIGNTAATAAALMVDTKVGKVEDGFFVKEAASLGKNINALDAQVGMNTMGIQQLQQGQQQLGTRITESGARAAALAGLHTMEFDPDQKWNFSAAVGNFKGSTATAVGAFYRPNDRVMFNVGSTIQSNDNMVNAGISFAVDKSQGYGMTRRQMIDAIQNANQKNAALEADNNKLKTVLQNVIQRMEQLEAAKN